MKRGTDRKKDGPGLTDHPFFAFLTTIVTAFLLFWLFVYCYRLFVFFSPLLLLVIAIVNYRAIIRGESVGNRIDDDAAILSAGELA